MGAARERYGNLEFLDFSANINPLGPPQGVFAAVQEHLPQIIHYPEPGGRELKRVLSRRLGVDEDRLILGNGAVELIYLLAHSLKPRNALIPSPAFSEYTSALNSVGTSVGLIYTQAEEHFRLDPAALDLRGVDILFICNPNNPTGWFMPESDFVKVLSKAQEAHAFVVVDESFMDFVDPARQWRACNYLEQFDRLFVLYSLTKFYAIPGLRLGCGVGSPDFVRRIEGRKDPWNVNSLALAAGMAALKDIEYDELTRHLIEEERNFLAAEIQKIPGLRPFPAAANFMLVHNSGALRGQELVDRLGARGILIRDCTNFPGLGKEYFRIAVKNRSDNCKLIEGLRRALRDTQL